MNQTKFHQIASALAPMMTRNQVKVSISGNRAYRTKGAVNLPQGDFTDPVFIKLSHGYLDHELGHERYTDEKYTQAAYTESDLVSSFRKVLEDPRMERCQGKEFPGAKINLENLVELCIERDYFPFVSALDVPAKQIKYFCLYWGRVFVTGQSMLRARLDDAELFLRNRVGDELIDSVLERLQPLLKAESNKDSLTIARSIVELLEDEKADSDMGDTKEDESQGSNSEEQTGDSRPESESETDEDVGRREFVNSILSSGAEDGVEDLHEKVANELSEMAQTAQKEDRASDMAGIGAALSISDDPMPGPPVSVEDAKQRGRSVYKEMRRVLLDLTRNHKVYARTGRRIARRRLSSAYLGAQNVFIRKNIKPEPKVAISFLLDASHSMKVKNMNIVNNLGYALATGLTQASVKTQVCYYGVSSTGRGNQRYFAKRFDDKSIQPSRFNIGHSGGTPTGQAMSAEAIELASRREDKKIMFVITDGKPADAQLVKEVRRNCVKAGIQVVPIGIRTGVVAGFDQDEFKTVKGLSDLNAAISHAISKKLIA